MSLYDDKDLDRFLYRDSLLPMLTRDAVVNALDGFALPLSPTKDMDWLALALRRALALTVKALGDGPQRKSNADIRSELEQLSELTAMTWQKLFENSVASDYKLWQVAWRHQSEESQTDLSDVLLMGEPNDYRRFKHAVTELDWLSRFLRMAALQTESQHGPWRQSEEKHLRVQRGQVLAPIFEAAFCQRVSANNYRNDARHKAPTAFMDFYSRIVSLTFGTKETTNLAEVVKTACNLHRKQPVEFAEGMIPHL